MTEKINNALTTSGSTSKKYTATQTKAPEKKDAETNRLTRGSLKSRFLHSFFCPSTQTENRTNIYATQIFLRAARLRRLFDFEQFDIKYQNRVRWNLTNAATTICQFRMKEKAVLIANTHQLQSFGPA